VLGWAAGTMSLAVMQLKCPHRDVGHVLLFHVAPLLLVVAATMLVRRRLPTISYAP
jgi:Negative regulator of sigma F